MQYKFFVGAALKISLKNFRHSPIVKVYFFLFDEPASSISSVQTLRVGKEYIPRFPDGFQDI